MEFEREHEMIEHRREYLKKYAKEWRKQNPERSKQCSLRYYRKTLEQAGYTVIAPASSARIGTEAGEE